MIKFNRHHNKGFSLIETLVYIFITAMLLTVVSNLLMSNFNIRRQLKASNLLYSDARFIINQLNASLHRVSVINDVRPDPEQIIFYTDTGLSFTWQVENEDLIYREALGSGPGAGDSILNSDAVRVTNFILRPLNDNQANANKGVLVNFTLITGTAGDSYAYLSEDFQTFISLR